MSQHLPDTRIPAPCIVNTGIIVNKLDIRRLLSDLGRVHYTYTQFGKLQSEGEGDVMEVFINPQRSTLVANCALYLNVYSFDYLELKQSPQQETYFDLLQEGRYVFTADSAFDSLTRTQRAQFECHRHRSDDGAGLLREVGCRN